MFAIAFDLVVAETQIHHPKGVAQAYSDIRDTLSKFEFDWVQGSLYVSKNEDLAKLFSAIIAYATCPGFHLRYATYAPFASNTQLVKGAPGNIGS